MYILVKFEEKKNPENLVITSKVVGTQRGGPIQGCHIDHHQQAPRANGVRPSVAHASLRGKASSAGPSTLLKGPPTSRGGGPQKAQETARALKSSHVGP